MSLPLKPLALAVALVLAAGCADSAEGPDTAAAVATEAAAEADAQAAPAADTQASAGEVAAPQLQAAMRDLWHGHIVHTRDYALAVHAGDATADDAAADAVVENARQLADAVTVFYVVAGGDQIMTMVAGHWGAVKAMTDARADDDQAGVTAAMNDLTANAGAIAVFLAGANPNLPED